MAAAACKTSSTLSLAEPSTLASAPTTATTAAASTPSCPTPPLPLTVFLTEDSPAFCGLQQQLDDQASTLSDIATSLQHLLTSSQNPSLGPLCLPQQVIDNTLPLQDLGRLRNPDSLPVDDEHKHAVLVNGILIKSVPSMASTSSTCHFTKLIPNTDHMHTWPSVASYVLTTCRRRFGHTSAALWAQQDQAAWNQHLSTATSFCPPPKSATPGSTNCQANTQLSGPPSKRQKCLKVYFQYNGGGCPEGGLDGLVSLTPLSPVAPDLEPAQRPPPPQGSAWHIDGPAGLPDLSTPPLQGLAQLISDSASTLDLGTPLLQGSAQLHPNTSFASNVFNPALQPTKHSSMQECAFAWSTLLSLYPDPVYHHQLLGMTEHSCLLSYDRPLRNAGHHSDNLPISSAGHSHLHREFDTCLAEGQLSIIPASTNLIELPIGVVPKPHSTKLLTIHHLSHPHQPTATALPSINAGISLGFIRIWYEGLQDLLAFVSQNPGCLLWKGNLEDAFRHIVTAECNMHLLSFSYNGIHYSCLPTNWPVNHYLDDTFGAIPVLDALLPIHTLTLAVNALGLQLSPKKTFGASIKLEVLGIEIDTVTQTVAFALAFACFLRSGKLVWDHSTDHATILTVSAIGWASDHVVLTLPASKTDPFQQVLLFGLDPLPQSTSVTILRHAIQACGLPASQYAGHSFCHGAATWASQHGTSTTNIQSLGQWSSNCYRRYIDKSAQERRILVASALFSIRDGPLVPSGPTWRDPGLA
ncbi:uncharacterized protein UBRO2_05838 [Ustilago bromivora]|uniref:Uncharacterized protein n=1 Tax=Ustilago bromivora TaxID=307758 RepID=A0A8H8QSD7_9BASI|nr:uncharacterized protein UBRO2_05838 [Ustilago bromivora]